MLKGTGWLFSGVLGFFPGLPTIAVYGLAALAVVGLPAGWAYYQGREGCSASLATEKAACELRISEQKESAARKLADLLETIDEGEATAKEPKTDAEAEALCKRSKLCRGNAK